MVLAALIANAAIAYLNIARLQRNSQLVEQQHQVLEALRSLMAVLVDAETGQRGYLLTGEPSFLAPYESASLTLRNELSTVEGMMSIDAERRASFAKLNADIDERMDLLRYSLELFKAEGDEAVGAFLKMGKGRQVMDRIRQSSNQMELKERAALAVRDRESVVSYWTALTSGFITAVLGIAMAIAACVLVGRDLEKRHQLSEALQKSKDRLEERVLARTQEIKARNDALRDEVSERTKAEQAAMIAAQELQRSNRELEQFASVASHDLQEPLRKIQAFGDRLRLHCHDQLGERGVDYLQRMLASAARMRKLIDDLLTYSRVTTKVQPFSAVDLNEVVEEITGDLEARLLEVGGELQVGKLPHIEADPFQMRQLFLNLLANALKFHRPGVPPTVQVSSQTVPAPHHGNGEPAARPPLHCQITVQDNGIGFEQVYVDRIFELFQRLHGKDEYQGTGMGLAICRKIVERHAGTITAYSEPGVGSRFVFTLPIQQNHPEQIA